VAAPVKLTKADARRAMVRHHFATLPTIPEAFTRLRSVQFDPIAPVGCNHDLVLQARLPGYKVGDWEKAAYQDRHIYDGWDKQASLIPFEGWPLRRVIQTVHREHFGKKIFDEYPHAVEAVLRELAERGPLMPKEFEFQERKEEWKGSWHGASLTKQTLRALWHSGQIITSGRKNGQHLYDLTERVVPSRFLAEPQLPHDNALRELALERYRAMGLVRPTAPPEIWSYTVMLYVKKKLIAALEERGDILPVEVDGMKAHTTADFLAHLDKPSLEPRVVFVAPLDPFLWDRKMTAQLFGFDYTWEIYTPVVKRRWGYYVLPILFGDELVARVEFNSRDGVLEMREWHYENGDPGPAFWSALEPALRDFMRYASATRTRVKDGIDAKVRGLLESVATG
jgi:uncharacterized protein